MIDARKTISAAIAAAVIASSGLMAAPTSASAAGLSRIAPVEANVDATNVGYRHGYHHGYNHYYGHCFWKKRKIWTHYGWHWKRFRVCY